MKHHEFYKKYKTSYPPAVNTIFQRKNWWRVALTAGVAVLIEPLIIMYKHQRLDHFSLPYYLKLIEYLSLFVVPFLAFLVWVNWRDWIKRSSGYDWLGKFEVIDKRSSFAFCYLLLEPGDRHTLKVKRDLFEKVRVGDAILIRRDALGGIKEIRSAKNFSGRLAKSVARRLGSSSSSIRSGKQEVHC